MAVPRQAPPLGSGRVNQKARTRQAIVQAAEELLQEGVTPTVAQAAERALVGRTTAYRYFPTQESLLVEVAMDVDVTDIEALVARPVAPDAVEERVLDVLRTFSEHVLAEEARYRRALHVYLDVWLAARAEGDEEPVVRQGRRRRWLETALAPLGDALDEAGRRRLVAALSLLGGAEALVVLRDVCRLDPEEGVEVTQWAARVLLHAALQDDET